MLLPKLVGKIYSLLQADDSTPFLHCLFLISTACLTMYYSYSTIAYSNMYSTLKGSFPNYFLGPSATVQESR